MGELDLELGGRQNTANASMEQRKQESQLFDDNESEKNEEHSSSVQIGLFVFCGPLPAILLQGGFFTELQVQIGHLQCNLTKPQVEICFQNAFIPLRFVVSCHSCYFHLI